MMFRSARSHEGPVGKAMQTAPPVSTMAPGKRAASKTAAAPPCKRAAVDDSDAVSCASMPSSAGALERQQHAQHLADQQKTLADIKRELSAEDEQMPRAAANANGAPADGAPAGASPVGEAHVAETPAPEAPAAQPPVAAPPAAASHAAEQPAAKLAAAQSAAENDAAAEAAKEKAFVERKNAIMRFSRKGPTHLKGDALQDFKCKDKKKLMFELWMANGENFEAINASWKCEVMQSESDRSKGVRLWKTKEWMLENKYKGNEEACERCIIEKTRLGQVRNDPDGSGLQEYLIHVSDGMERETESTTTNSLTGTSDLDQSALRILLETHFKAGGLALAGPPPAAAASSSNQVPAGRNQSEEEEDKKAKEEQEKQEKQEKARLKKEAAQKKLEEQKADPLFQAKAFCKNLLGTISDCKTMIGRLRGCTDIDGAEVYVQSLSKDEKEMDEAFQKIQADINVKDIVKLKAPMSAAAAIVTAHHKRFRLARGQVQEIEKMQKEQEADKSSQASGGKKKGK